MKPIKTPTWIIWITNPKYCTRWLKLKWQRLSKTKKGRKRLRQRLFLFIKRNALLGSVILLTIQLNNERSWRRDAERKAFEVQKENNFIRGVISMRNSDFQSFPRPWWEKIKKWNYWRFLDLNVAYEYEYGFLKNQSLGKSNEDIFGIEVGEVYSKGDLDVWLTESKEIYRVEPNPNKGAVFVYKYGRISVLGDSISSGFTLPLEKVKKAIFEYEN